MQGVRSVIQNSQEILTHLPVNYEGLQQSQASGITSHCNSANSRLAFHGAFACGRCKQVSRQNEPNAKKTRRFSIATEVYHTNSTNVLEFNPAGTFRFGEAYLTYQGGEQEVENADSLLDLTHEHL